MQVNGQLHASAALRPGKKPDTHWRENFGGPQSRSGGFWRGENLFPLSGVEYRTIQPVATLNAVKNFISNSVIKICQFSSLKNICGVKLVSTITLEQ
jgi:hypothetical protein